MFKTSLNNNNKKSNTLQLQHHISIFDFTGNYKLFPTNSITFLWSFAITSFAHKCDFA